MEIFDMRYTFVYDTPSLEQVLEFCAFVLEISPNMMHRLNKVLRRSTDIWAI